MLSNKLRRPGAPSMYAYLPVRPPAPIASALPAPFVYREPRNNRGAAINSNKTASARARGTPRARFAFTRSSPFSAILRDE